MIDRKDVPVLMSNMDKDSELSQFFNEYWKFVKEFLNGKEEQREKEYWDELVSRSQEMSEKYNRFQVPVPPVYKSCPEAASQYSETSYKH